MPSFDSPAASHPSTKLLYMGDSGAGKTGSLVSLAAAGYNVRIMDLDRGTEIIRDFVMNPASPYLKASPGHWLADAEGLKKRLSYVTITEEFLVKQGTPIPRGTAWKRIGEQLDNWTDGEVKLGNVSTWGAKDVLVIDSLSRVASAAFNFQLVMNGRAMSKPEQSDWGQAQVLVERLLTLLYDDAIKCNVIVVAHIAYIETDAGPTRGFPQTIGKALSPKIGQFFNHALMARSTGQGPLAKRVILTNTTGMVELKNSAPLRVKPEYPLESGLADYFADIRGGGTSTPTMAAAPATTTPAPVVLKK